MEDENDVLDWEEDDEQIPALSAVDDADGVSLGSGSGDEDEDEAQTLSATAEEAINPPILVSEQRDSISVTRQVTVPPPTSHLEPIARTEDSSKSRSRRDTDSHGHSDSNSSPPPKSGRKRQKRTREPPASTLPKVHGLPPKPVASTLAFMAPSHPSLTEATAMSQSKGKNGLSSVPSGNSSSRTTGEQRPHSSDSSSNTKPPSSQNSGTEATLPSDWQVRQSRSSDAVYYYNTRTHESTWVKPVLERTDTNRERSGLTYEDRHYRPGTTEDATSNSRHTSAVVDTQVSSSTRNDRGPPTGDNRYGRSGFPKDEDGDSDGSYHGRSARDRTGRRSPSPVSPHRSRDVDMDVRAARHLSSQRRHDRAPRPAVGDREKDYNEYNRSGADEFQIHNSDRHWIPRDEAHSRSRPGYEQAPDGQKLATRSSRRHPPPSPQDFLPQAYEHRQYNRAEPFSHESREERKKNAYPPTASRSRDTDSREQRQPQSSLPPTNRHRSLSPPHPMLMTTAALPPPPLAATNSATLTSSTSGRRNRPSRFDAPLPEEVDDWVPDEFLNEARNDSHPQEDERLRERSREPEREIRERKPQHYVEDHRENEAQPERGRSASPDLPASRRKRPPLPPQSMRFREMTSGGDNTQRDPPPHRDNRRASKFGPPLPTAISTVTRTDVDSVITPSAPRAFDILEPLPPSGPRGRSRSFDGDGSHTRGRGPPRRDKSRGRSRSYSRSRSRSRSMEREREPERPRRGELNVELPKGPRAMEHHSAVDPSPNDLQGRRPAHLPAAPLPHVAPTSRGRGGKGRGRRGREQVTVSGTNNIPVGSRGSNDIPPSALSRFPSQHDPAPPSAPPKGLTGGNVIPLKNARTRGYGNKAEDDIGEPLRSYSRSRSRTPPRRARESPVRREERDAMEVDRAPRSARVRRESFTEIRYDSSSFTHGYEDPPPPGERTLNDSRRWGNRNSSPLSPARYRQPEREILERVVTPPPSSRATSRVSPYDDREEDRRTDRHLRRNTDSTEDVRVSHEQENNAASDSVHDGKQNGYKMQHPLPMNPMLLRMGPTTPVQPTGPTSPSTSYPRHRDRSPAPLPPVPTGNRDVRPPSFSKDSPGSPPVTRQSKPPVKIRRPPPPPKEMLSFSGQHGDTLQLPAPMVVDESEYSKPRRPSPRRGASLLDRLSLTGGVGNSREENMTPSLKDRVLVPSKRDRGELDEPVVSDRHEDYHAGNDGWGGVDDGGRGSSSLPYESGGSGKRRRPYRGVGGGGGGRKPKRSNKTPA